MKHRPHDDAMERSQSPVQLRMLDGLQEPLRKPDRCPDPRRCTQHQQRNCSDSIRREIVNEMEAEKGDKRELLLGVMHAVEGPEEPCVLQTMQPVSEQISNHKIDRQTQVSGPSGLQMKVQDRQLWAE